MSPSATARTGQPLYRLREVRALLPGEGSIGPITWTLLRGQRIGVRCATATQWDTLRTLLTGEHAPSSGRVDELTPLTVQTDVRIREGLRPSDSLQDFLDAPGTPEFVRLDGRRHSLMVLVDLLDITPAMRRRIYKFGSPELLGRVWALRFILSQADLLIGREVFSITDPLVHEALCRHWGDWPGTVIAGEGDLPLPGPVDAWARVDADGCFATGQMDGPERDLADGDPEEDPEHTL